MSKEKYHLRDALLGVIPALLLIWTGGALAQGPARGDLKIDMKSYNIDGSIINIEQSRSELLKVHTPLIQKGMRELRRLFEIEALPGRKIWFAASGKEMRGILSAGIKISDQKVIVDSIGRRSYADSENIAVMYDPGVSPERLIRFILAEYTLDLMDAKAPSRVEDRATPFYYGLSEYLGWYAYTVSTNTAWNEVERQLSANYLNRMNPRREESVFGDPTSTGWRDSIAKYGEEAFSESVLGALFLVRLTGIAHAVRYFDFYEKSGDPREAFQKTAGIDLAEFQSRFRTQFLPELKGEMEGE
jgi:hypothetical protein